MLTDALPAHTNRSAIPTLAEFEIEDAPQEPRSQLGDVDNWDVFC